MRIEYKTKKINTFIYLIYIPNYNLQSETFIKSYYNGGSKKPNKTYYSSPTNAASRVTIEVVRGN